MTPEPRIEIVVWFSCGSASAVAAKRTIEMFGDYCNVRVVNTEIKQEDKDNRRFLRDIEKWLGVKIEQAFNKKYPDGDCEKVWDDRKYMSGTKGAPCTGLLKKEARYQFEAVNKIDYHVMGFAWDELRRYKNFVLTERDNVLNVLGAYRHTKDDCFDILLDAGIKIPLMYYLGYINANCPGCVKATSPTYWNHVRKVHPEVFQRRAIQSRRIGCKLVRLKGKRIFLDELPADAKGRPMKTLKSIECGIFCEEQLKK